MQVILNPEQRALVDEAKNFYRNSSEQVFQFSGGPGTGKSVVLNAIRQELNFKHDEIVPMAYTGAAAIVMRRKGFYNAKTIHSSLYHPVEDFVLDSSGNIVMDTYLNRPKIETHFEPVDLYDKKAMFIDEGGGVPFEMKGEIESRGLKIFVAGDLDQLPPVEDKPAYLYSGNVRRLNQIMRQASYSYIPYLANRAIRGLPIQNGYYGDCLVIDEDELTDEMIKCSDIILCGRNNTRELFNKKVRQDILGINYDLPTYGERVICRKNNWKIEVEDINLANGLIGSVVNAPNVGGFDGKTYKMSFQPTMMNSYFADLCCDYNYLIAPPEIRKRIKTNKYSVGEMFEFAYAISTHISQGSQFNYGIYFEEFLNKDIQKNLNYTGITRFSQGMIYVKKKKKFYFSKSY